MYRQHTFSSGNASFIDEPGAYRGAQGRGGVTMDAGKRKKLERFGDFFEAF